MPFQPKDVKFVKIDAPVGYLENDIPNDFPFRNGNKISFLIEHPAGEIIDFPTNYEFSKAWAKEYLDEPQYERFLATRVYHFIMKVEDKGTYTLLDEEKHVLAVIKNGRVPDQHSIPGEYGDFINFYINFSDGSIENWDKNPSFREFK